MQSIRRRGRAVRWLTVAVCAFGGLTLAAPASALTDADAIRLIETETAKFHEEMSKWAADLARKGEAAKTGSLTKSSTACGGETLVQPFLPWGDRADYALVPGATFEGTLTGWQLGRQGRIVTGNSSFYANAKTDKRSLEIRKGGVVTTRAFCVTEAHPTIRLFTRSAGLSTARLKIEVLYEDLGGSVKVLPIGWIKASTGWQPTEIVALRVQLRAQIAHTKSAAVALRLTPLEGDATWYVDDVYVDPFRSR